MRELSVKDFTVSQSTKAVLATLNWTAALVLLSAVTFGDLPLVFAAWSVICAVWGATFIGWALIVRERLALENLVDFAVETYAHRGRPVRSLH